MGVYLNPKNHQFQKICNSEIYVDKTKLITLTNRILNTQQNCICISRPRRFGKTLNMSMLENFFSMDYAGRGDLFEGLSIWEEEKYRTLQGTYPVISLSFARITEDNFEKTKEKICQILTNLYIQYSFVRDSDALTDADRLFFDFSRPEMTFFTSVSPDCSCFFSSFASLIASCLSAILCFKSDTSSARLTKGPAPAASIHTTRSKANPFHNFLKYIYYSCLYAQMLSNRSKASYKTDAYTHS